jgi:hypothetical protein
MWGVMPVWIPIRLAQRLRRTPRTSRRTARAKTNNALNTARRVRVPHEGTYLALCIYSTRGIAGFSKKYRYEAQWVTETDGNDIITAW